MIRTLLTAVLAAWALAAPAQEPTAAPLPAPGGRIYRTEAVPYDLRHEAEVRNRAASGHCVAFRPEVLAAGDGPLRAIVGQRVDIPFERTDGLVYLHIENAAAAYSLWVNDREAAYDDDPLTPADYDITPYIRAGENALRLLLYNGRARLTYPEAVQPDTLLQGSYLYYQDKRSIRDFALALVPDTLGRDFGMLDLSIVAQNAYNYEEPLTVGYDIYSPQGKLLDFNMREIVLPGRSIDTVRFTPLIYGTSDNRWQTDTPNPPLYRVMLFTRRRGVYKEYMPLRIGFGRAEFADGRFLRHGREVPLVKATCNATTPEATRKALRALKAQGTNTVCPDYPQPAWFYGLCDELGLQVIDRADIHAPEHRADRTVGGTPSNDPALLDAYLDRVKAMYYRSRNFTCVIAYALGGPAGNGYNLYKAYEWLKSVEPSRPVFCEDADGEWNSDL